MNGLPKVAWYCTTHRLHTVALLGFFAALGYSFGMFLPANATNPAPTSGLLLGLGLLIGWSQSASP